MDDGELESVVLPMWRLPFPSAVNKFRDDIRSENSTWARNCGLMTAPAAIEHYENMVMSDCASYMFPTASLEKLTILGRLMWWFFIFNDQFDEGSTGTRPEKAEKTVPAVIAILYGDDPAPDASGPLTSLSSIVRSLNQKMDQDWMKRFARGMSDYMRAYQWETRNRATGRRPSLVEYQRMRLHAGGMIPTYDCVEYAAETRVPYRFRESEWANRFLICAANAINWSNDVISLPRNTRHQHINNPVHIIKMSTGGTLQQAVDEVEKMVMYLIEEIQKMERELPQVIDQFRLSEQEKGDCLKFFRMVQYCMTGAIRWQKESSRYNPENVESVPFGADPGYLENLFDVSRE